MFLKDQQTHARENKQLHLVKKNNRFSIELYGYTAYTCTNCLIVYNLIDVGRRDEIEY